VSVASSVTTFRYTSSNLWKRRSLSDTTTKLVTKPRALARRQGPPCDLRRLLQDATAFLLAEPEQDLGAMPQGARDLGPSSCCASGPRATRSS
jgi:hypothetical protein